MLLQRGAAPLPMSAHWKTSRPPRAPFGGGGSVPARGRAPWPASSAPPARGGGQPSRAGPAV
eukprot:77927-Prorocentrum_minimum.AAC.1